MIAGRRHRVGSRRVAHCWQLAAAALLGFSALPGLPASAADGLDREVTLDIPAQPLPKALLQFGHQATVQMMLAANAGDGQTSKELKGTLRASAALDALLRGSGLSYQATGNTVTIASTVALEVADKRPSRLAAGQPLRDNDAGVGSAAPADNSATITDADSAALHATGDLAEVIVTGSHIRGAPSGSSNVTVLDRNYIDNSGYADVPDILRTLPQNFGGGVGEVETSLTSDPSAKNFNSGTAINLRGLGADSTLTLVNGRRQPLSGYNGAFTDVSGLPASAIERIEVVTDGASAIYGSDAVGGVVNFILRKDFEGAETTARFGSYDGDANEYEIAQLFGKKWSTGNVLVGYQFLRRDDLGKSDRAFTASDDLRPFGGNDYRVPYNNPGNLLDPNTFAPAYAIPKGQNGVGLTAAQLLPGVVNNFNTADGGADLLPRQSNQSVFFYTNFDPTDQIKLFAEGRYSNRDTVYTGSGYQAVLSVPDTNPFYVNPFPGTSTVYVGYNMLADFGPLSERGVVDTYFGTLGGSTQLPGDWLVTLAGSYGRESSHYVINDLLARGAALNAALADPDPSTAFDPFADGSFTNPATLAALKGDQIESASATVWEANLTADGKVLETPWGSTARAAIGADYRRESLDAVESATGDADADTQLGRTVTAVFAELSLPLAPVGRSVPGIERLDLSVAGRHEHYSDFGSTTNPKIGLNWAPISDVAFHGTWGTSFKAPRLIQLYTTPANSFSAPTTLQTPTGSVSAIERYGNNPDLKQETAHTWTAGFDIRPEALHGMRMSMTYFDIDYKNRVSTPGPPGNPDAILLQAAQWANFIILNPTRAQINTVCSSGPLKYEDLPTCLASTPQAIVDVRLTNLAETVVRGVDADIRLPLQTGFGAFEFGLDGTYTLRFGQTVTSSSPAVNLVNTEGNVPKVRIRADAGWRFGDFSINSSFNFTGRYEDNVSSPNRPIASWTTMDLTAKYHVRSANGWFDNLDALISVVNIANRNPPFVNVAYYGFDPANANPYGRILSAQLRKKW